MKLLPDKEHFELTHELAVFLLRRGLAAITPEADGLIRVSFSSVIYLLDRHRISWDEWNKIKQHLNYSHTWRHQSRTEKLCDGIARHVVENGYTDHEIGELTDNNAALDLLWQKVSKRRSSASLA